jgi:hypothetical protein
MQYQAPIGASDPDQPYIDGNASTGTEGSPVPAAAIEHPMREIINAIVAGGEEPDETKQDQLATVIAKLLSKAVDLSAMPLYPEIMTADNRLRITDLIGSIEINSSQSWLIRGAELRNTDEYSVIERTFNYEENKTYHLRWNKSEGFVLKDLDDSLYNIAAKPETDMNFDSSYDDMLIARVITDETNSATITKLINVNDLQLSATVQESASIRTGATGGWIWQTSIALEWSRTPLFVMAQMGFGVNGVYGAIEPISVETRDGFTITHSVVRSRYYFSPVGYVDTNSGGVTKACTINTQIAMRG